MSLGRVVPFLAALALWLGIPGGAGAKGIETDWYGGAGIGFANVDLGVINDGSLSNTTENGGGLSKKFFVGHPLAWDLIPFPLAIEFGYIDLPKPEFTGTTDGTGTLYLIDGADADVAGRGEGNGVHVSVVGRYSPMQDLDLIGKLGLLLWDTDLSLENIPNQQGNAITTRQLNEAGLDIFLGFGAQYRIDQTFSVRGELEYYRVDYRYADGVSVLNLGVSVVVDF